MKLRRRLPDAPLPYVPMADLAFNLLIFFLVLAKTQQDTLPWDKASAPGTREMVGSKVTVTITKPTKEVPDRKIYLNGFEVGVSDLPDQLNSLFGDSSTEKRTVLLKIDKDAPAALYKPVLEAVSQAGGEVFNVLEEEK